MTYFIAAVKARGMKLKKPGREPGAVRHSTFQTHPRAHTLDVPGSAAGLRSAGHEPGRIFGIFPAGGIAMKTKKSRPVLAHQSGKGKTFTIILPLLRGAVKMAATAAGVYMAAALAALNWPALLAGTLALNATLGMYFRLEGMQLDAARNPQTV